MSTFPEVLSHAGVTLNAGTLPQNAREWAALLGRTHVIMIHFPIALLLMAALGECWRFFLRRPAPWTAATLICGATGGVLAMALGWLRVWFNGYEPGPTLTLHQYMGTATALVAVLAAAAYWKTRRVQPRWWTSSLILLAAGLVGITGHLGGTLVHGNLLTP